MEEGRECKGGGLSHLPLLESVEFSALLLRFSF